MKWQLTNRLLQIIENHRKQMKNITIEINTNNFKAIHLLPLKNKV